MIVEGLPEGMPWAHSLKDHLRRNMEVNKWFQPENFVQFRNSPLLAAISTLFPDQYDRRIVVPPSDRRDAENY